MDKRWSAFPIVIFMLYISTFILKLVSIVLSKQVLVHIFSHGLEWFGLISTLCAFKLRNPIWIIAAICATWFMFLNSLSDLTRWNMGVSVWQSLNQTANILICFLVPLFLGSLIYVFLNEKTLALYEFVTSKIDGVISKRCRVAVVIGILAWSAAAFIWAFNSQFNWPKWIPFSILIIIVWLSTWKTFLFEKRHGVFFLGLYFASGLQFINQTILMKLQDGNGRIFSTDPFNLAYVIMGALQSICATFYTVNLVIGCLTNMIEEMEKAKEISSSRNIFS